MASRSVNKVILVGRLGKDAETKFTPSGTSITRFSVATSRRWKDQASNEWKEDTNWTDVALWKGEAVAEYLTKGKQVYVEGRLQTRSYDDVTARRSIEPKLLLTRSFCWAGSRHGAEGGGFEGGGRNAGGARTVAKAPLVLPRAAAMTIF